MVEVSVSSNTPNAGGMSGQQLMAQNAFARQAIHGQSRNMVQNIYSQTIATPGAANNIVNISPRLVGFAKRFYVEAVATIANGGGANTLNLTSLGPANLLSRINFTDLANNVRHNSPGWHFHFVSSAKRARPFGSAFVSDSPVAFGSNFPVISAPATIAHGATGTVRMVYEVPITYDDNNLSGGIWLGVTAATANLQLTINPLPGQNTAADTTLSMYSSATGAADCSISSITINVYQNYLDQLPIDARSGQVILPYNDISTVYMLQDTTQASGLVVNQDYPIPYANNRDFLSTFAIFDNGGTLNSGSDVVTWGIQAANFINFVKYDPTISALMSRNAVQADFPPGVYYFGHRHKPISTSQFGNTELVLNPSVVNAGAKLFIGYEMFALVNLVAVSGALAVA